MKKMTLLVALSLIGFATFAQQKTMNAQFQKVKIGHNGAYVETFENMVNKFFPAKNGALATYSNALNNGCAPASAGSNCALHLHAQNHVVRA
jgi:hypothetical protein